MIWMIWTSDACSVVMKGPRSLSLAHRSCFIFFRPIVADGNRGQTELSVRARRRTLVAGSRSPITNHQSPRALRSALVERVEIVEISKYHCHNFYPSHLKFRNSPFDIL